MKWKRSALRGSKGRKMPDVLICSDPSCLVRIWVSWVVPATQVSIVVLLCDLDHVEAIVFYAVSNWRHYRLGDACWCWSTLVWKSSQGMIQLCSWFGDLLKMARNHPNFGLLGGLHHPDAAPHAWSVTGVLDYLSTGDGHPCKGKALDLLSSFSMFSIGKWSTNDSPRFMGGLRRHVGGNYPSRAQRDATFEWCST